MSHPFGPGDEVGSHTLGIGNATSAYVLVWRPVEAASESKREYCDEKGVAVCVDITSIMWKESWKKIASVIPILLTIDDMLVSSCEVRGTSMKPTLNPGTSLFNDRVLVDKLSIKLHQYRCGDVVVVRAPDEPHMLLVKRLRALEGDWVKTQGSLGMTQVPKVRQPPFCVIVSATAMLTTNVCLP